MMMGRILLISAVLAIIGRPAWAQTPAGPGIQAWMVDIITRSAGSYDAAPNDMAKGLIRHQRAETLCAPKGPIKTSHGLVKDWAGRIENLSSVSDGRGVLAVRLADNLIVETTNNEFSEQITGHPTLIRIGSPLYQAVVKLSVGQKVLISGTFFGSKDDCAQELSMTPQGAMDEPEFLFRFDAVRAAE